MAIRGELATGDGRRAMATGDGDRRRAMATGDARWRQAAASAARSGGHKRAGRATDKRRPAQAAHHEQPRELAELFSSAQRRCRGAVLAGENKVARSRRRWMQLDRGDSPARVM